jgi:hypothetical protein
VPSLPSWTSERARVASLSRSRPADDPELLEARRNLAGARLDVSLSEAVERYLATLPADLADATRRDLLAAPPLSEATRDKLTALLRGGAAA